MSYTQRPEGIRHVDDIMRRLRPLVEAYCDGNTEGLSIAPLNGPDAIKLSLQWGPIKMRLIFGVQRADAIALYDPGKVQLFIEDKGGTEQQDLVKAIENMRQDGHR